MAAPSPFRLDGRRAVVTGGGRGIGEAIARALGEHGAAVLIAERDEARAHDAAGALRADGIDAHATTVDVTRAGDVARMFDEADARLGGLDILVNNAGMSQRTAAEVYPDDDLERMIALNLTAVFACMRAAARRWIHSGAPGAIVNLGSFASVVADPLSAPYAATKGAVLQLTRTCAVEWAPHGIRVNAIGPGYTRTDMTAPARGEPETLAKIRERTPLGRVAEPAEIATAAVYLASDAASYVTGHLLMVDGGWTAL